MSEPWWLPDDSAIRAISALIWFFLKIVGAIYVFYRLESIAEAVGAFGYEDNEDNSQ